MAPFRAQVGPAATQASAAQVQEIATPAEHHDLGALEAIGGSHAEHQQQVEALGSAVPAIALAGMARRIRTQLRSLAQTQEICMSVVEKMKSIMGAYSATDIRSLLQADHERISALTERISSDESKGKRVRAFDELKPFLTAHARAEEQAVYLALVKLRGSPDSRADGNEGFVEHSLVDVLMERLSKTELAATAAWKAHAKVLQEMLDHHIKEEERGIFEELGLHFTDEQRDAMGADFVARKRTLLATGGTESKKAA